jgi:hypothetical protein
MNWKIKKIETRSGPTESTVIDPKINSYIWRDCLVKGRDALGQETVFASIFEKSVFLCHSTPADYCKRANLCKPSLDQNYIQCITV